MAEKRSRLRHACNGIALTIAVVWGLTDIWPIHTKLYINPKETLTVGFSGGAFFYVRHNMGIVPQVYYEHWSIAGFHNTWNAGTHTVTIHVWPLLLLLLTPLGLYWIKRRRLRKNLLLCQCCGYDLRASKDTCPECGEPILKTGSAS